MQGGLFSATLAATSATNFPPTRTLRMSTSKSRSLRLPSLEANSNAQQRHRNRKEDNRLDSLFAGRALQEHPRRRLEHKVRLQSSK
jgi:hypothetical protein